MLVRLENRRLVVKTQYDGQLLGFMRSLPDARWDKAKRMWTCAATPYTVRRIADRGGFELHNDVARLGKKWFDGSEVDDPIGPSLYGVSPWRHQKRMYDFSYLRIAAYLAAEMGCGKSAAAVWLLENTFASNAIIVCPKAVLGVWPREFARHARDRNSFFVCVLDAGSSEKNRRLAEAAFREHGDKCVVLVVNYESLWRPQLGEYLAGREWHWIIADELHRAKAAGGKASSFLARIGMRADRRLGLSGTPFPQGPLDAYGQFRFLEPALFGTRYQDFATRYAVLDPQFPSRVLDYRNLDEFKEKIGWMTLRIRSADVLDLPPVTEQTIGVRLSPAAMRVYRELEEECLASLCGDDLQDAIERAVSGEVVADNVLVQLLRLRQIASGHVATTEGAVEEIDKAKQTALADLLEDIPPDEPVVVFCEFRHNLSQVEAAAKALKRTYGEISGRRKDLAPDATMPDGIHVMGVQWQSGSTGIDLTRARYGVIYTPTFNRGDYEQGLKRLHRPGQTRHVHFYRLIAEDTVDRAVYGALAKKGRVAAEVFSE